jgi:hypothetical protein
VPARDRACRTRSQRDHRAQAWCGGAVPAGSLVAEVEGNGQGEHQHGATVMPGKEPWVGAHRGGGTTVGWWRDLDTSMAEEVRTVAGVAPRYAYGSARVREG